MNSAQVHSETILPGQHFYIDFSFMQGSDIDGGKSFLLIIDKCSCYTWAFLTKTKAPPTDIIKTFLAQHGNKSATHCTICTDKGGDLWGSYFCQEVILQSNFILDPTTLDAPNQMALLNGQIKALVL
jgi:hypothetical protein